jgi:hypothetical protein
LDLCGNSLRRDSRSRWRRKAPHCGRNSLQATLLEAVVEP